MILPDVNLLIEAHNGRAEKHEAALEWWESLLNSDCNVGLAWVVVLGFIRISTNRRALTEPITVQSACSHVRSWLTQPNVAILHPGRRHADILLGLLEKLGTAANLTTDAHLAAIAIEHQAELHSRDADFGRFPGLKWRNPID